MRHLLRATTGALFCTCFAATEAHAGDPAFTNVTASAGVTVTHAASGYAHANYTGGGTVGDFNNDGWQDLFVLSGGGGNTRDHLFINQGDGTFQNQSQSWGLVIAHSGKGASVADFNNDCHMDIFVTSAGPVGAAAPGHHKLYRNNGDGTFTNIAASAGVNFTTTSSEDGFGSGWGDYDLDGDLDLVVAGFAFGNNGQKLFRNNGDETFTDVTDSIGLFDGVPSTSGFAPRLQDMNGDWFPDLLFIGDFGSSAYFGNDGDGTFTDLSNSSGTTLEENGMGQTVGDFNGDGRIDWYVASIYLPQIGWTGNKLYLNQGSHAYNESAASLGCDDGGYGWGCVAIDFNHDRRLDIAETNGGASADFFGEQSYLWMQDGAGDFDEMALGSGFVHTGQGRGLSNFDYDNDGDQDVVIFANNEPITLMRNDLDQNPGDANWIRVFLDTHLDATTAPNGYGARVVARVGGGSIFRWITTGDNFESHSEISAHFGLGTATVIDEIRVEFPNGVVRRLQGVAANQIITIALGTGTLADINGDEAVDVDDLAGVIVSWGQNAVAADVNQDGTVNVDDLIEIILQWGPVERELCVG